VRYFTEKGTNKWVDILDELILSYNNTYHSSIKTEPNNVSKVNEDKIYENLYGFKKEGDSSILKKLNFQLETLLDFQK
jgi:hypothetical protein